MRPTRIITATSLCLLTAACAQNSNEISASYVSPLEYQTYSCSQLRQEATRVSRRAAEMTTAQDQKAQSDAGMTAISLILFWPAAFMIDGDDETAGQLARLKGEMDAIEQANIQKNCGIQFGG